MIKKSRQQNKIDPVASSASRLGLGLLKREVERCQEHTTQRINENYLMTMKNKYGLRMANIKIVATINQTGLKDVDVMGISTLANQP